MREPRSAVVYEIVFRLPRPGEPRGRRDERGVGGSVSDTEVFEDAFESIRVDRDSNVAIVTIDHPDGRNALNAAVRSELKSALPEVEDSDARVIVPVGSDECKPFAAGADVTELRGRDLTAQGERRRGVASGRTPDCCCRAQFPNRVAAGRGRASGPHES